MTKTGLRQKESTYLQELLKYTCQTIVKPGYEPAVKKIADENLQETQKTIESSTSSSSEDSD